MKSYAIVVFNVPALTSNVIVFHSRETELMLCKQSNQICRVMGKKMDCLDIRKGVYFSSALRCLYGRTSFEGRQKVAFI